MLGSAVLLAVGAGAAFLLAPGAPPGLRCSVVTRWGDGGPGGPAAAQLHHPMGLAWSSGTLYVADAEHGALKLFREDGGFVTAWSGFERPVAVAATGSAVYVADFLTDRVTKLSHRGSVLVRWGRAGRGAGQFEAPSGIAVDSAGEVYVADFYNHRIEKFDGEGAFLLAWGAKGRWRGRFRYPTGISVSPDGEVFVADAYNHRVQKFTTDGQYVGMWGGLQYGIPGSRPGWFRLAKDVAVDSRGDAYVADAFNHRLQGFTSQGALLGVWDDPRLRYPAGVAVGRRGDVYVSDFFGNAIWKLGCR